MKALVFGAGGLIGSTLLEILANDERYAEVIAFNRSKPGTVPEKIKFIRFNYREWEKISEYFTSDAAVFCCIGTTKSKTPDYQEYRSIDLGIPLQIADMCVQAGCSNYVVISSLGADVHSGNFYLQLKGEMEDGVADKHIKNTWFLRPSLLLGARKEKRPAEWMGQVLGHAFSPLFIGILKKYKPVHAETVAQAMANVVFSETPAGPVENEQIIELGRN